ncbi:hypothetical protein [Cytobacillus sp. NCCP-133]|nr:hypothetical protein [Cytobacillus sp. NCCP-133]GLB60751.1 hypothetical protein NCCP133_28830 [Cytobacillus sp. NCCP-133]
MSRLEQKKNLTIAGTDIEEVKRLNSQSGFSYHEVKKLLGYNFIRKQ